MTTYTATAKQGSDDLRILSEQRYDLQVAKSVAGPDGSPHFNVVYKSKFLAPTMSVSWTSKYGLNWTCDPPNSGGKVKYWGDWQSCAFGASYDLDEYGEWVPNQNNPSAQSNSLNVGRNGYERPVYIIIGAQNDDYSWQAIWVSPDQLLKNSNGEYEPLQTVQIWYEEDEKTTTIIGSQKTPSQTFTYTDTISGYFMYDAQAGVWQPPQPSPFNFEAED